MASKYDFVSIDFETANSRYDSACSIGLAAVRDMAVVDTFYSLINYDGNFLPANISIHGFTQRCDIRTYYFRIIPYPS